ncbi:MAG: heavy-metal-associated domain-containing protein [Mycobacteriales bacterium]
MNQTTVTVTGMTCAHCVQSVSEEVSQVGGVESVAVDLGSGRVTITSTAPVDLAAVRGAVEEAGYAMAGA